MRVLGLTHKDSGCGFHRVILPLGFMHGTKALCTNYPAPEIVAKGWDILLYNRLSIFDDNWPETKETLDIKVVMDMDDDWILPPNHVNYHSYEIARHRIENNIRHADLVTCTNERLAKRIREFSDNVVILPNALPFGEHQYTETRQQSDKVRIFWAGGASHEHDLAILRNPIKKLSTYKDKIEMVIGGYSDVDLITKSVWDKMASSFTSGGKLPHRKLPAAGSHDYMQMYEHADIMLIPLEDSEWHASKSNLKILEAASKRIPVIVSNVEPYSRDADAPVLWVNNQKDWNEHLNFLINKPAEREELGDRLYKWAVEKYNINEVNKERSAAFGSIIQAPALL